ncbi:MAG TPA: R3H domain-containing nucleic acid-binding protein [Patescibacteria group bacterium]|nr:R3H domain-containing nucleic acid-binding protein [Patescibacteria group bacterium]
MKKATEFLQKATDELLSLMSVKGKAEISYDKTEDVFTVNIEAGDTTGLLIGKKGETLSSLQTFLGIALKQHLGEWKRVVVNVGDYREKEEDYLKNLADSTATRAIESKEPQSLYNLKAWQRRIIHMHLSENPDITTESVGEGEERYLVVKSKR